MNRSLSLFILIFIEGYIVLSTELLVMRQAIPYVGSGTDTVSIIIAAVLLPLAFGYYNGGRFKPYRSRGRIVGVREQLIRNLFVSTCILLPGLLHTTIQMFFSTLFSMGISDRLLLTTIYVSVFLVYPVYLLGQTIPLASNYFSKEKLSKITGRILFISTCGSFVGAVFSTLVLMSYLGVHHTASINFVLLAALAAMLVKNKTDERVWIMGALAVLAFILNSDAVLQSQKIVSNNQYNTIQVNEAEDGSRHFSMNNNASSRLDKDGKAHDYAKFMESIYLDDESNNASAKDILVIGAGGFTLGLEDKINKYDFVDIDPALLDVAETHFLKQKLSENKEFHPLPARGFITQTQKKYDVVILDAYLGDLTIPEHLVTQEFFLQIRGVLKERGIVLFNFITQPDFSSAFSRNIDATVRSVFPFVNRYIVPRPEAGPSFFSQQGLRRENAIYTAYVTNAESKPSNIYTDNVNRVFYDKAKKRESRYTPQQ